MSTRKVYFGTEGPALASDSASVELLQRMALRWASERFSPVRAELERERCPELPDAVVRDMHEQGWLPSPREGFGDWSSLTIAKLGQALGKEAPAVFVPILTHVLALFLSANLRLGELDSENDSPILATTPYWDFSKVATPARVDYVNGGWLLSGHVPLVVNGSIASIILVPALTLEGNRIICGVRPGQLGVSMSDSIPLLGLRGASVRNVDFASVSVAEDSLLCSGELTQATLEKAYLVLKWGVLGLLSGLVARAWQEAKGYASLRMQGGRRIIDHPPVAKLIEQVSLSQNLLNGWLEQSSADITELPAPLNEVGRSAILATDAALQVFGGSGYICPGVAERCWRDARQAATLCSVTACPGTVPNTAMRIHASTGAPAV